MTGTSQSCIYHHGNVAFGYDDAQHSARVESAVAANGGSKGHDSGATHFFKTLAEHGVGLHIRQHHKTTLHQGFSGFECLDGVGHEKARIGMNFEFQPVGLQGFSTQFCGKDGFFCGARATGVGKEIEVLFQQGCNHVVGGAGGKFYALESYGH